jgi:hypothetical protein
MAMWPEVKLRVLLGPLLCSTNQEIVVSPEGLVRPYPPTIAEKRARLIFVGV